MGQPPSGRFTLPPIDLTKALPHVGDQNVQTLLEIAYKDGYKRGLTENLSYLQEAYMDTKLKTTDDRAKSILVVAKELGVFVRERLALLPG